MTPMRDSPNDRVADIIAFLDHYIESEGRANISAVEAAAALDRAGLLEDSSERHGLPLRNYLRSGKLPHAYQPTGKNGRWVIPSSHSARNTHGRRNEERTFRDTMVRGTELSPGTSSEAIRAHYRPTKIRLLFVGESAPVGGNFFYYMNSQLFQATHEAFKNNLGEAVSDPSEFLAFFQDAGFFLDDLCLFPVNGLSDGPRRAARTAAQPHLAARLRSTAPEAIVVVMKAIYNDVARAVHEAGQGDVPILSLPFPGRPQHKAAYVAGLSKFLRPLLSDGTV